MDSFSFHLRQLKNFSQSVYDNSICIGNIAYILAKAEGTENKKWIREAGYLCDIGATQIGPIFTEVNNKSLLSDPVIKDKLRNTRRFHVKRSMDMIDYMDDIDIELREYFKELVDHHHCLYNNELSYCGHNFGLNSNDYIPYNEEIGKEAQLLSAAVLLSSYITKEQYQFDNMISITKSMCRNKAISEQMGNLITGCIPEIKHAYQNNSIHQPTITSLQQKQALASFGGGIFSQEHGVYRYQDEHNAQTKEIHQQSFTGWDLQM